MQASIQAYLRGTASRLYAVLWFAAAVIGAGLGTGGAFVVTNAGHYDVALRAVEARRQWIVDIYDHPPAAVMPGVLDAAQRPATIRWFVAFENCQQTGNVFCTQTGADKAIAAGWEQLRPFQPHIRYVTLDLVVFSLFAAALTAAPILLLALLRWIGTGRRGFGWTW